MRVEKEKRCTKEREGLIREVKQKAGYSRVPSGGWDGAAVGKWDVFRIQKPMPATITNIHPST